MKLFSRFPVRLAALFLVLLTVAGVATTLITVGIYSQRQVEIDQRLNRDLAASMAAEIEPLLHDAPTGDIGSAMHYMMVLNPAVEIYLLDGSGRILNYFTSPGPPVQLDRVAIEPIREFVSESESLPIYGDNPRRPGQHHHFSAAPITLQDESEGYLYVILRSSEYETASMGLQRRYLLEAMQRSMLITIPLVGLLGLVSFVFTTKPLQRLIETVRAFGSGDYQARSSITARDEIGDLARNFNRMADTIVDNLRRVERADRERRELIANISHDLRNPLATMQGYLETLSQREPNVSEEERARYYEILLNTTKALPRLVDDLFELSKLEDPDTRPPVERFSLSELAQDVVMQWKPQADDRGIRLTSRRPRHLHLVDGNVGLIERTLSNLIRNALNHTPSGGAVEVSLDDRDDAVRVTVTDTGPGVSPENQTRIFDRFFIADESRTRSREGSGLGLAICKRIVELHDGRIGVESEPGSGSAFWFELALPGAPNASK